MDRAVDLYEQSLSLPIGEEKLELLQKAIRIAAIDESEQFQFALHSTLMEVGLEAGRGDLLSLAFAWCIERYDRNPEQYSHHFLWAYRWVINELGGFQDIPVAQVTQLLSDMKVRYENAGLSLRPCYVLEMNVFPVLGDLAAADSAYQIWPTLPNDEFSDGKDSELDFTINHLSRMGQYEAALKKAQPILKGRRGTAHSRGEVCSQLLIQTWQAGNLELAQEMHIIGYECNRQEERQVDRIGEHIAYLALTKQFDEALEIGAHWTSIASQSVRFYAKLIYFLRACILGPALINAGIAEIPHKVAEQLGLSGNTSAELSTYLLNQSHQLTELFDKRNGNNYFEELLKKHLQLL
ncbi:MAG: hypothetical protein R3B84_12930 [Zavarzinella sp.]